LEYYVWSKKKPKDADEGMVFPGVEQSTWTYDNRARAYYFHRFYDFQPDLNIGNPAVRDEILKIMGFWLELGGDKRQVELAFSLLFSMPGTPTLWYGDEIGMGDDLSLPEREGMRARSRST
jgi:glycosidase